MKIKNILTTLVSRAGLSSKPPDDLSPGRHGENLACRFLKSNGYKIIEKNFRTRFGEIDIVAEDNGVVCFVEVKARTDTSYGLPEEYVDRRKQVKIVKTSQAYIKRKNLKSRDMRFDIVSVSLASRSCRIIKNAFYVGE